MKIYISFFLLIFSRSIVSQTEIWGMTQLGGQFGAGTIFKTDGNGDNQTMAYDFFKFDGAYPGYSNAIQATDGNIYGMTNSGGLNYTGNIFKYNPITYSYSTVYDFENSNEARNPSGSLLQAYDGKLYGLSTSGGIHGDGTLFQFDILTNTYVKKIDFDASINGKYPLGTLIQASNGKLYGVTYLGGVSGTGVIFEYDIITGVLIKLFDFVSSNGSYPAESLIEGSNGMLYGQTRTGGLVNLGVLFKFDITTNSYSKIYDYNGFIDGANPCGALTKLSTGLIYGTTTQGGVNNKGIIFEYNPSNNVFSRKYNFSNGSYPYSKLYEATDGYLYGMTFSGGTYSLGTLYQFNPSNSSLTNKLDFNGPNGSSPYGSVFQSMDGYLYCMTSKGGVCDYGTFFKYHPSTSVYSKIIDFSAAAEGAEPNCSLTLASDNKLYGISSRGGTNNSGIIFQIDPINNSYLKKYDLDNINGKRAFGNLVEISNGVFYGTTCFGGLNDKGTLFKYISTNNSCSNVYNFIDSIGINPNGDIVKATNGKLYGLSYMGGSNDMGTIFEFDPVSNICTKKINFDGINNGGYPLGSMILGIDNKLYGMATNGGLNNFGTLFQYDPILDILNVKYHFDFNISGGTPKGKLTQGANGIMYGLTGDGGVYGFGTIFTFDPINNFLTNIYDFQTISNGIEPHGSLLLASDNNLYGMTNHGGNSNYGTLFQYNISTNVYTKKVDFNDSNGKFPNYNSLIEINASTVNVKKNLINKSSVNVYPNPSKEYFSFDLIEKSQVTLTNVLSEEVLNTFFDSGKNSINIKNQENGIYFLKVLNSSGQQTIKIVKE